jgi:hypothetical protein
MLVKLFWGRACWTHNCLVSCMPNTESMIECDLVSWVLFCIKETFWQSRGGFILRITLLSLWSGTFFHFSQLKTEFFDTRRAFWGRADGAPAKSSRGLF